MYFLRKTMRMMVDVIGSVLRVGRPRSELRISCAYLGCFQKRMWVTLEMLVRMSRVLTGAEASWTYFCCFQKMTWATAEVLVSLLCVGMLGSNPGILRMCEKQKEVALHNSDTCRYSRVGADYPEYHLVYESSWWSMRG